MRSEIMDSGKVSKCKTPRFPRIWKYVYVIYCGSPHYSSETVHIAPSTAPLRYPIFPIFQVLFRPSRDVFLMVACVWFTRLNGFGCCWRGIETNYMFCGTYGSATWSYQHFFYHPRGSIMEIRQRWSNYFTTTTLSRFGKSSFERCGNTLKLARILFSLL